MTLRTQIRSAVDDVAPPAVDLERRVVTYMLADAKGRKSLAAQRSYRRSVPLRLPVRLVAAALLVALVGGVILAGRVWRDLNGAPANIDQHELKSLESRPLHFPVVAAGGACPDSAEHLEQQWGMVWGDGPVYVAGGNVFDATDWGEFGYLNVVYDVARVGLVVVRFKDLKADADIVTGQYPLSPSGISAAGPVIGQQLVSGHEVRLRSEAVFRDPWHTPTMGSSGNLPPLILLVALQKGSSGCIGFQFDGPGGFSENFVIGPDLF